ncbi:MAG: TAXI family TRAP transporter solute-binding subunit [Desulfosoma sp.]
MRTKPCVMMAALMFSVLGIISSLEAVELGIVTGSPKGTYYQIGMNLQELMRHQGIELKVHESKGSVDNIYAVFKRSDVQLGIVQSDVLAFVAKVQTNPTLKRMAQKLKIVFPLYDEEIHLVGRKDIADFDALQGKRVAVGEEGSGTYLTAKLLLEVSQIKPANTVPVGMEEALQKIKEGSLDAMFCVAGYPVKFFAEDVTIADNLKLIPIENKTVLQFYPQTTIPGGTYSWQPEAVRTVTVKAALITFDYRAALCEDIGRFARILGENLDWLMKNGHPKWRQVDLSSQIKGWEQSDCVRRAPASLKPTEIQKPRERNPVLEAIKGLL